MQVLCTIVDISERKRIAELQTQRDVAEQESKTRSRHANLLKGFTNHNHALVCRILATMSHEIRTPLTGIIGSLELLRNSSQDSLASLDEATTLDHVATAQKCSEQLMSIINDILDFSKLEACSATYSSCFEFIF
jgi:signal transduction histidine kinase